MVPEVPPDVRLDAAVDLARSAGGCSSPPRSSCSWRRSCRPRRGRRPRPRLAHPEPDHAVTIAGSLQSELGCAGDWDPACAATHLTYDAADDVWQGTFSVPAGSWEYKAALNDGWDENYGANAAPDGANIPLNLARPTSRQVLLRPQDATGSPTTSTRSSRRRPAASSPSSAAPATGSPDCLRSWLQDPDGDGIYTFETTAHPGRQLRGQGRDQRELGRELRRRAASRTAPTSRSRSRRQRPRSTFSYDAATHVLTITGRADPAQDNNVEWDGLRHDSRDTLYRTPGGAVPAGTP